MARVKLDAVDMKILSRLQSDGRITNVDLAKEAGITAPPCLRRMRALEKSGYIKGYHAELDHKLLGFGITVFALVRLHNQSEKELEAFENYIATLPEVRECYMLNGEIDFILKVVAKDLDSFQKFLTTELTPTPNVASIKTSLTIRNAKKLPGVPLGKGK